MGSGIYSQNFQTIFHFYNAIRSRREFLFLHLSLSTLINDGIVSNSNWRGANAGIVPVTINILCRRKRRRGGSPTNRSLCLENHGLDVVVLWSVHPRWWRRSKLGHGKHRGIFSSLCVNESPQEYINRVVAGEREREREGGRRGGAFI